MNRRSFFGFIAAAPLLPIAAKAEGQPASTVNNSAQAVLGSHMIYIWGAGGGGGAGFAREFPGPLVCENHRDKAWPEECDCGPGMRIHDVDPFAHQLS